MATTSPSLKRSSSWLTVLFVIPVFSVVLYYFMQWFLQPVLFSSDETLSQKLPAEELMYVSSNGKRQPFESTLESDASVYLSIIIPAYNEEARLPVMMDQTLAYLEARKTKSSEFTYELLIVDDASQDRTYDIAQAITSQHPDHAIRVLRSVQNHGKGGAIRKVRLPIRLEVPLFTHADVNIPYRAYCDVEASTFYSLMLTERRK